METIEWVHHHSRRNHECFANDLTKRNNSMTLCRYLNVGINPYAAKVAGGSVPDRSNHTITNISQPRLNYSIRCASGESIITKK